MHRMGTSLLCCVNILTRRFQSVLPDEWWRRGLLFRQYMRNALPMKSICTVHAPHQLCVNRKHGLTFGACFPFVKKLPSFLPIQKRNYLIKTKTASLSSKWTSMVTVQGLLGKFATFLTPIRSHCFIPLMWSFPPLWHCTTLKCDNHSPV